MKSNSYDAWLDESAVRAMRKKLKLSSDDGDFGSNKCKREYGCAYGDVWQNLRLAAEWSVESVGSFHVGAIASQLVSRRKHIFTFNLLLRNFINVVLSMRFANTKLQ
jgi:hypothetical protein